MRRQLWRPFLASAARLRVASFPMAILSYNPAWFSLAIDAMLRTDKFRSFSDYLISALFAQEAAAWGGLRRRCLLRLRARVILILILI